MAVTPYVPVELDALAIAAFGEGANECAIAVYGSFRDVQGGMRAAVMGR